ncbi:MAG: alanine--glyoxylate aminotransferase family protein [Deltaproteobacteria bacterium]|nr:alanine--glyoxylate aminotransferase family protein [Deltaproteobacteria bacterium]
MKKKYLLSPGPTAVPESVLARMAEPMIHHRTPQFSAIFAEVKKDLKALFQTEQEVLILASSGTGAMESAITNLFCKGDKVIFVNGGKFGERWGQLSKVFGLQPIEVKVEWGQAVDVAAVKEILDNDPEIKAVLTQASETSTTVAHPVKALAKLTKDRDTLLVVDGITAVGVSDLSMDETGIDVLISGSQKAFMLPPGLAFIALSDKAWKFTDRSDIPKYYLDLKKENKNQVAGKDTTAYTPAVSLICGLAEVLRMVKEEGLENLFKRHATLARATRAALTALGLKLLAPDSPADSATGAYVPEGVDGGKFVKFMRDDMGVTMAGGQDHLKGKIFRVAHLGYYDTFDIIIAISTIEMALKKFGHNVEMGKGVAAAQAILVERY